MPAEMDNTQKHHEGLCKVNHTETNQSTFGTFNLMLLTYNPDI